MFHINSFSVSRIGLSVATCSAQSEIVLLFGETERYAKQPAGGGSRNPRCAAKQKWLCAMKVSCVLPRLPKVLCLPCQAARHGLNLQEGVCKTYVLPAHELMKSRNYFRADVSRQRPKIL